MRQTPRLTLRQIALRNARAAADVDLLASGWTPDARTLGTAPRLEGWIETLYPGTLQLALAGRVTGHPTLGDRRILTSPIIARGAGWIRTESRFYVLGAPGPVVAGETIAMIVARLKADGATQPDAGFTPPTFNPPDWKDGDDALPGPSDGCK